MIKIVSLVFVIALSLVFNIIAMEIFKMQLAQNRRNALRPAPFKVRLIAGVALAAVVTAIGAHIAWNGGLIPQGPVFLVQVLNAIVIVSAIYYIMAEYKLRTETVPPIGIYRLLWYIIIPLIVSAVLSCWLFSIDPSERGGDVVVNDGIITNRVPRAPTSSYQTPAISSPALRSLATGS